MRVSRSLTIKQMAMVAAVAVFFIGVFIVIQLFHFVQQSRYDTATQMEKIAHSVRLPLSAAILKADIPQAEEILNRIQPSGIISRADVVLPNQFQALRVSFIQERQIPVLIARVFELPVQISLPLYSLERPANPQPLAYLVLQADSSRMYRFIISTISTLLTTYLLLALILTVAISWCINRLVVHPIRKIARELNNLNPQEEGGHQLRLPPLHHDDEIGMLVRSYNRNQQMALRLHEQLSTLSTRFAVSELPNKTLLLALLEQMLAGGRRGALLVVASETLQEAAGTLNEQQREMLLLTLVEKIKMALPPGTTLAQLSASDFGVIAEEAGEPEAAMLLAQRIREGLCARLPIQTIQLKPTVSIGIALFKTDLSAEQLYRRASSAAFSARRYGKDQIQFFDQQVMVQQRLRLTRREALLNALENNQFAIWLQPQLALQSREIVGAAVMLRMQQPDGSWSTPEELCGHIDACGLAATFGSWMLEASCRTLAAWQHRGVSIPLSLALTARQLLEQGMAQQLQALLRRYPINAGSLSLEVAVDRSGGDPAALIEVLCSLHRDGISLVLDDCGVDYAALPLRALKIECARLDTLPQRRRIAEMKLALAQALNLETVADGVENEAQRRWLAQAGVCYARGPLFAEAQKLETFEACYLPT